MKENVYKTYGKGINQPDKHGVQVRIYQRNKEYSRYFSFKQWGSKAKALTAAKNWRDQITSCFNTGSIRMLKPMVNNLSGVAGVCRSVSFCKAKGKLQISYQSCWTDHTGKLKNKTFYVGNGDTWEQAKDDLAFETATAFRQLWEKHSDNNTLKQFDHNFFKGWQSGLA